MDLARTLALAGMLNEGAPAQSESVIKAVIAKHNAAVKKHGSHAAAVSAKHPDVCKKAPKGCKFTKTMKLVKESLTEAEEAEVDADMDADDGAEEKAPKADKEPKEEKPKAGKDVPPVVAKFVTSPLAKKLVDAGLATDPEEDEGASLIKIVQPFYDAGFKEGKAEAK